MAYVDTAMGNTIKALAVVGLLVPANFLGTWKYYPYRICSFISIIFMYYLYATTVMIYVITVIGDLVEVADPTCILIAQVTFCFKCITLFFYYPGIHGVIDTLREPIFNKDNAQHARCIDKAVKTAKWLGILYPCLCAATLVLISLIPLFDISSRNLPLKAWLPYDTTNFPMYEITYFYQSLMIIHSGSAACTDSLVAGVILLTCGQIDILCHDLKEIRNEIVTRDKETIGEDQAKFNDYLLKKLNSCIILHQAIIKLIDEQQNVFNSFSLLIFTSTVLIICITAFTLSLLPIGMKFLSMTFYMVIILTESLIYCHFGNELVTRNEILRQAAYHCGWEIHNDKKFTSNVMIFMERLKKPLVITTAKLFDLTLITYMSIVKSSYSYFTLLKQVHSVEE